MDNKKLRKKEACVICKKTKRLVSHHVSYGFMGQTIILRVCYSCHGKIHSGHFPALLPNRVERAWHEYLKKTGGKIY